MKELKELYELHKIKGHPLYFKRGQLYYGDKTVSDWLLKNSVTHAYLTKNYIPSVYAAGLLDVKRATITKAIRDGKLGKPLYDYSQAVSGSEHYIIWVSRVAFHQYAKNRRQRSGPRST